MQPGGSVRRPLMLALLVLVVVSVTSCGGRRFFVAEGSIEVVNSVLSFGVIEDVEAVEVFGRDFAFVPVVLFPGDSVVFDVRPGLYDVTVFWDDGGLETFVDVDVFAGVITRVVAIR